MPKDTHLSLREMPRQIELSGVQYIELLAALYAVEEVFCVLNDHISPSPAEEILAPIITEFHLLAGEVGPEDDQREHDPIIQAYESRGAEIAHDILAAMAKKPGFGLEGVLPEMYAPRVIREYLWREVFRLGDESSHANEAANHG